MTALETEINFYESAAIRWQSKASSLYALARSEMPKRAAWLQKEAAIAHEFAAGYLLLAIDWRSHLLKRESRA